MKSNEVTYTMIETAVDKGLRDFKKSPKRTIRNLVDLGEYFSTGHFQKDFFQLAQYLLSHDNSPYYELIKNTVSNVDHRLLKTFGINLGYNSWTYGADVIRKYEKTHGCNVPWTILFKLKQQSENTLSTFEISDIIEQGTKIGIYTYMFDVGGNQPMLDALLSLIEEKKKCAFILFVEPDMITEAFAGEVCRAGNTVVSVRFVNSPEDDNACFDQALSALSHNKCLYGLYYSYSDKTADNILKGSIANRAVKGHCTFTILMKDKKCSLKTVKKINQYIAGARGEKGIPLFVIDLYEDIAYVDRNISAESCFLTVNEEGNVATDYNNKIEKDLSIRISSLTYILEKTMPKVSYATQ